MTDEAEIRAVETARVQALLAADGEKLASLLADDLVHIHANGLVDGKESYLAAATAKIEFLNIERPELRVRLVGDCAIVTGPLNQSLRLRDSGAILEMQMIVTQVWDKRSGQWLQNSFHAGRVG